MSVYFNSRHVAGQVVDYSGCPTGEVFPENGPIRNTYNVLGWSQSQEKEKKIKKRKLLEINIFLDQFVSHHWRKIN